MILTPTQRKYLERAVATANEVEQHIHALSVVAGIDGGIAQRHTELKAARDRLHEVSLALLQLDRDARNGR